MKLWSEGATRYRNAPSGGVGDGGAAVGGEVGFELVGGHRRGIEMALERVAAGLDRDLLLLDAGNAFGDDLEIAMAWPSVTAARMMATLWSRAAMSMNERSSLILSTGKVRRQLSDE